MRREIVYFETHSTNVEYGILKNAVEVNSKQQPPTVHYCASHFILPRPIPFPANWSSAWMALCANVKGNTLHAEPT